MQADDILREGQDRAVEELVEWLKIPSISTKPEHEPDLLKAAKWGAGWLQEAGVDVSLARTEGAPVIYGEAMVDPKAPTVLIYGHYDVQPEGDLSTWSNPPFEPWIADDRIYGRGSADNKGQVFCQMRAVAALLKAGRLPVNVKFMIEGGEEIGSPYMDDVLKRQAEELACDLVVISDTPVWKPGQPALSYGVRGNFRTQLTVQAGDQDLHSGIYGGSVPNPIAALGRMISELHDDEGRIAVPGWYDDAEPIPDWEREAWAALGHDDEAEREAIGSRPAGEAGYSTLERRWGRPTLEFNGITGGYQGPGSNTIVPSHASVKITGRTVPGQSALKKLIMLGIYFQQIIPEACDLSVLNTGTPADAYRIDAAHPALGAAAIAFEAIYGVAPVKIRNGLSLPILSWFKEFLGADTVLLGFCHPDCGAHSFDEFFGIDELEYGSRTAARFLLELGTMGDGVKDWVAARRAHEKPVKKGKRAKTSKTSKRRSS